jgi:hypothetical protein
MERARDKIKGSMNIKKISILGLLVGVFIIVPNLTLAQLDDDKDISPATTTSELVVLSTANVQDTTINSQDLNKFNISFNLTNKEIIQSGLRYGVKLMTESDGGQVIIDEKVYPEVLTLYENSVVSKIIDYQAPENLTGEYSLLVTLVNERGVLMGSAYVDEVKLVASKAGVVVRPETCFTQIIGEDVPYFYGQVVDIASDEFLIITCEVVNTSTDTLTVVPAFTTYYRSVYGNDVYHEGGDTTSINLDPKEEREVSVLLPKADISQMYEVVMLFKAGDEVVSNSVRSRYFLQGKNASINNVWLDKDFYKIDDEIILSIFWESRNTENFFSTSTDTISSSNIWLDISIVNSDGIECVEFSSQELLNTSTSIRELAKFSVALPVINECKNPAVLAVLRDESGHIFDQMSSQIESIENKEVAVESIVNDNPNQGKFMIIVGSALLILLAIILFFSRRKKMLDDNGGDLGDGTPDYSSVKTLSLIFCLLFFSSLFPNNVEAVTYCSGHTPQSPYSCVAVTMNVDKSSYVPNSTIRVTTSVEADPSTYNNSYFEIEGQGENVTGGVFLPYRWFHRGSYGVGPSFTNINITAPSAPGSYYIKPRSNMRFDLLAPSTWGYGPNLYMNVQVAATAPSVAEINLNKSTALTTENFTATWSGNNSPTSYNVRIESNTANMGSATNWTGVPSDLGLGVGSYKFYAQACNSAGCSPWSSYKTLNVTAPLSVPAPTLTFTASPTSVTSGRSSTLTWTTANATACTASGDWSGAKLTGTSRMESTGALVRTKIYNLRCTGPGGLIDKSVAVSVIGTSLPPAPTLTFTASPTSVTSGRSSTLTWTTANATACTASGSWVGTKSVGTNKTESTGSLTSSKIYTLRCTGLGGSVTKSVAVNVTASVVTRRPYVVVCPNDQTVEVGNTVSFKALYWASERNKPACNNTSRSVDVTNDTEWTSRDTALFTVDNKGVVAGISIGSASLYARYQGKADLARVDVIAPAVPPPSPPIIEIEADPNLIRSGNAAEVSIDITAENDLDCSLNGVGVNTINFTHTSNSLPQTHKFTTRLLSSAQIVRVRCEVRGFPAVSTSKETRIDVVPYLQEI